MLTKKPKVLFVTSLFSPFQIELAYEINKINLFEYYVTFSIPYSSRRGKHWLINIKDKYAKYIISAKKNISLKEQALWAAQTIVQINPQIIISGIHKGLVYKEIVKAAKSINSDLAIWAESPNLLYPKLMTKIYQKLILKRNFKHARFILSIGDRAVKIYEEIFKGDIYMVPYAQDLSLHFNIPRNQKSNDDEVIFLFSGQLVRRHNIQLIAKALVMLYEQYPNKFRFVIAGYGPEEPVFRKIISKKPNLEKYIIYDRDYKTWENRVYPFSYSDILIYPSRHSGWGLVVPEAMAAGMLVISTSKVEAASYYIKHNINGIIIKPELKQLLNAMDWCIINKDKVFKMAQQARIEARKGMASNVAKQFCDILKQYLA